MDPSGSRRWWDGMQWTSQVQQPTIPTAPPAPRPIAPLTFRVIARAIDFVLVMILAAMVNRAWVPRVLGDEEYDTSGVLRFDEILPTGVGSTVLLAIVVIAIMWELYWLLAEGATPGKQLLGLYVTDPTSARGTVEIVPAIKRILHRLVAVIPFGWLAVLATSGVSLVLMFEDRMDRRSVMDRFARTTVHRLPPGSPRFTPWLPVWLMLVGTAVIAAWLLN